MVSVTVANSYMTEVTIKVAGSLKESGKQNNCQKKRN